MWSNSPKVVLLEEEMQRTLQDEACPNYAAGSDGLPRTDFRRPSPSTPTSYDATAGTFGSSAISHKSGVTRADATLDTFLTRLAPERNSFGSLDAQPNQHLYSGSNTSLCVSVKRNFIGLVLGLAIGLFCAYLGVSKSFSRWLNLPGTLFLRALNCVVVPYVFCCVSVAIGDLVSVGKVSTVGKQTAKIFAIFWVASVSWAWPSLRFRRYFKTSTTLEATLTNAVGLACANGPDPAGACESNTGL